MDRETPIFLKAFNYNLSGGREMKTLGLILMMGLLMAGCATFNHSEYIDADQPGCATGKYVNNSSGPNGSFIFAGAGAGWGGGAAGGFGAGALAVTTGPPNINACNFARSMAMINYSKRLKSVKYDEFGGVIEYEFEQPLTKKSGYSPSISQPNLPPSFGHQPIE